MKLKRTGYNQTVVSHNNGVEVFFSYDTPVAGRSANYEYFRTEEYYSRTTTRHVNNYLAGMLHKIVSQEFIDTLADGCPAVVSLAEVN